MRFPKKNKVNILGTVYSVVCCSRERDERLNDCDGYCDKTTKQIVVLDESGNGNLGNFAAYQRKVLRHEIIHAFMFESGLAENWQHAERFGQDETVVDWFAIQFPKICRAYNELGIADVENLVENVEKRKAAGTA